MMITGQIATENGEFHYLSNCVRTTGSPLVICLHGFPDHPHSFTPILEKLADNGYWAIAPWMRGYGPSISEGPFHADQLAADVIGIAQKLSPNLNVAIVGHDWGAVATFGAIMENPELFSCAVSMAVPHPITFFQNALKYPSQFRRSWYMLFFQLRIISDQVVKKRNFSFVDYLWETWSPGLTLPKPEMQLLKDSLGTSFPAPLEYYRAIFWPPTEAYRRIRKTSMQHNRINIPLLHLHGANDGCVTPEMGEGQETFFQGPFESKVIEEAGHFLQVEAPMQVGSEVTQWMQRYFPLEASQSA